MPLNKFWPFGDTATGTNLLSDDQYSADPERTIGHQPGIARQELANKQARQASATAAGVGEFIAGHQTLDVSDSDTPAQYADKLFTAIRGCMKPLTDLFYLKKGGDLSGTMRVTSGEVQAVVSGRPTGSHSAIRMGGTIKGLSVSDDSGTLVSQVISFTQNANGTLASVSLLGGALGIGDTGVNATVGFTAQSIEATRGNLLISRGSTNRVMNLRQEDGASGGFGVLETHGGAETWAIKWDRSATGDIFRMSAVVGGYAEFFAAPGKAIEITGFSDYGVVRLTANNLNEIGLSTYRVGGTNMQWAIQRKSDDSWTMAGGSVRTKSMSGLTSAYANTNGQPEAIIGASNGAANETIQLSITEDAQNRGIKASVRGQDKWLMRAENKNDGTLGRIIFGDSSGTAQVVLAVAPKEIGGDAANTQWVENKKTEAINTSKAYTDSKVKVFEATGSNIDYKVGNIRVVQLRVHVGDVTVDGNPVTLDLTQYHFTDVPHPQLTCECPPGTANNVSAVIRSVGSQQLNILVWETSAAVQDVYVRVTLTGPTSD